MHKIYHDSNTEKAEKPSFEDVKEALLQMFAKNNYSEDQLAKLWEQA